MGCYMSDEIMVTQIDFRLLGTVLQECGGMFTVISGFIFALIFYFVYNDWINAAINSVKKYENDGV